jgi:hypothetical protein
MRKAPVIRRTKVERKAALELRKQQIEQEIADLDARSRTEARAKDTRQKIVIGAIVVTRAKFDLNFQATLRTVLLDAAAEQEAKKKQRPHDLKIIFEFLGMPIPQNLETSPTRPDDAAPPKNENDPAAPDEQSTSPAP